MTADVPSDVSASPATAPRAALHAEHLVLRRRTGHAMAIIAWLCAALTLIPLVAILAYLVVGGASALTPSFLFRMPRPAGTPGGGMANAMVGTLILVGVGATIGVPIGLGAGLYSAERADTRLADIVRFVAEVLSGVPSIVIGVFVWEIVVRPSGHFSALAGGVALGLLIIPLVTRATEEMVKLVPTALSEAAMALGFSRWRTSLLVVLRTAMPGIFTAALVAISRAAGETAPLLFTAFGNAYWSVDLAKPIAALPLQIFAFALSPYDDWRAQALAGALMLLLMITAMSLLARAVINARRRLTRGAPRTAPAFEEAA